MSLARFQYCLLFQDPNRLFFELGVTWSGDPMDGTRVVYRRNGCCTEICTHVNGQLEGFRGSYLPLGSPHSLLHYRRGKLYGEAQYFNRAGNSVDHIIYTGEGEEQDFTDEIVKDYPNHRFCQRDWDTAFHFHDVGPQGWVEA